MKRKVSERIDAVRSSGNVFADLGLPNAEQLLIKSGPVIEIAKAINKRGLTQVEAAARMGIAQPKVSNMLRGNFTNLSERKLMECLNRLGYDIEIRLQPTRKPQGQLMLSVR